MITFSEYHRRNTSNTMVGNIGIGSDFPIRIQTMANTSTNDIEASIAQARRCAQAGADLFRFTTQGMREVESLKEIGTRLQTEKNIIPLVADIHFRSDVADEAAKICEKVRINPGNYAKDPMEIRTRFLHLIDLCKQYHTALRIGVNHGSLSERVMAQYGDTPEGMVASCMEFLRIAVEQQFTNIVLSIKASNTRVMVDTVLLLVRTMDAEDMHFPLHLGVTEAGEGEDGRIKSAVGIGALLAEGIGDTIRVSLSEEPEAELPVARALVDYFTNPDSPRYTGKEVTDPQLKKLYLAAEAGHQMLVLHKDWTYPEDIKLQNDILQAAGVLRYKTEFVSCPGCGRTMFDLQRTVKEIKQAFDKAEQSEQVSRLSTFSHPPKIAIMGCIVNGPGEMADADFGYVGAGRGRISLYKGRDCILKNIPQEEAVDALIQLIKKSSF